MKNIGYLVIIGALAICVIICSVPTEFPIEPMVGISFGYFLLGIYILILDKKGSGRVPKMRNSPAPPERGVKISIDYSSRENEAFPKIMEELKQTNHADYLAQIEGNFNLIASTKKKCICNDISKHSSGGFCLGCFEKSKDADEAYQKWKKRNVKRTDFLD